MIPEHRWSGAMCRYRGSRRVECRVVLPVISECMSELGNPDKARPSAAAEAKDVLELASRPKPPR